jgi:hypothetical protein
MVFMSRNLPSPFVLLMDDRCKDVRTVQYAPLISDEAKRPIQRNTATALINSVNEHLR